MTDTTLAPKREAPRTFTHDDVQAWVDSLGERESAMLAHLVGDREYRAAIDALGSAVEFVGGLARRYADRDDAKASRIAREVMSVVLRVKRATEAAGAAHAGEMPRGQA